MTSLIERTFRSIEGQLPKKSTKAHPLFETLLRKFPPRPFNDKNSYRFYLEALKASLMASQKEELQPSSREALRDYARLVSLIIGDYERRHFALPKTNQGELLQFLIEQHSLAQTELAEELGGQSVVSSILRGKRGLNAGQMIRLGKRFNVEPGVFLVPPGPAPSGSSAKILE